MVTSATSNKRLTMEKRREERLSVRRPIRVGRRKGVMQNISTSGAFFETDVDYAQGSEIIFAIELDGSAEKKLILRCRGIVVRVEHRVGKVGVGLEIVASQARVGIYEERQ